MNQKTKTQTQKKHMTEGEEEIFRANYKALCSQDIIKQNLGICIRRGEWVSGSLLVHGKDAYILLDIGNTVTVGQGVPVVKVFPDTVCKFVGICDMKGNKIYRGDILRFPPKDDWEEKNYTGYEVFFHDNDSCDSHIGWQMDRQHFYGSIGGGELMVKLHPAYTKKMTITGNIYDDYLNPNERPERGKEPDPPDDKYQDFGR